MLDTSIWGTSFFGRKEYDWDDIVFSTCTEPTLIFFSGTIYTCNIRFLKSICNSTCERYTISTVQKFWIYSVHNPQICVFMHTDTGTELLMQSISSRHTTCVQSISSWHIRECLLVEDAEHEEEACWRRLRRHVSANVELVEDGGWAPRRPIITLMPNLSFLSRVVFRIFVNKVHRQLDLKPDDLVCVFFFCLGILFFISYVHQVLLIILIQTKK